MRADRLTGDDRASPASVTIIGASVRGTSALERILASASDDARQQLIVHVIDPYPPGSGRIWRAAQSSFLIMNTVAAQSTLFTDGTVECEGPIRPGPSLAQWCRLVAADPAVAGADAPTEVIAEAVATRDHSNPSRLLYGHYLRWCFEDIVRSAPPHVEVRVHRARAIALERAAAGWSVELDDGNALTTDAVLLAVGWLDPAAPAPHARVIAAGNPIDQDLSPIRAGEIVAVRGLGMGFFDTLSQLTEQRGGRFIDLADGSCRYEPSGEEPFLVAGSRRGLPYRAKPDFGAPPFFPEQRILRAALPRLRSRRPVDFARDVLPLIERDAAFDYYRALVRVRPGAVRDAPALLDALRTTDESVAALVAIHIADPADRLSLVDAADPFHSRESMTDADVASAVRRDADEAARGMESPLKLALHSYAAARSAVIDLVGFGGLTTESFPAYRAFLATAASFGSGPPLRRARQLLAAHEAGVVRFAGGQIAVEVRDDGVTVATRAGETVTAERIVEAWLPAPTVKRTADPLLRRLLEDGIGRVWRFPDGTASDALDVRAEDGAVVGSDGTAAADLFSVGVPHEDIRVFTIIAPVPHTNSTVLREIDAAARAALRAALSTRAEPIPTIGTRI